LRQAIIRPAEDKDIGVCVETALVERLVADAAGEPGSLPLLQETLVLLWERLERRFLPLRAYAALGDTGRTGLQVALARRADAALSSLTTDQQALARRIFLRLIQFGEGRVDTRRQQIVTALRAAGDNPNLFEQTLRHLAKARLLTLGGAERPETDRKVDLAHEALITGWPTLQQWVSERREAEQIRRRLEGKAEEWVRLGRGSGGLLDDVEMLEVERWLASLDAAELGYSETLPALRQASCDAMDSAAKDKEDARQRELAQAQALAAEQQRLAETERRRAEEQARGSRRLRWLVAWLVGVFLFALGVAFYAIDQQAIANAERIRAEEQAQIALTRQAEAVAAQETAEASEVEAKRQARIAYAGQLAAQSQAVPPEVPQAALLLAVEAYHIAYQESQFRLPAVEQALHDALRRAGGLPLLGHAHWVNEVAFSPNGKWLATASADTTVRLWQMADPTTAPLVLSGSDGGVEHLSFSADGHWLATVDRNTARLWNMDDLAAKPFVLDGHDGAIRAVAFSPDGHWLATSSQDKTARLWDVTNPTAPGVVLRGHTDVVREVVFSPDGQWLATASSDHTVRLWQVADPTAEPVILDNHLSSFNLNAVAFSPDGRWLATASVDDSTRLWEMDNLTAEPIILESAFGPADALAFSPQGMWLATVTSGSIRLWDMHNLNLDATILLPNPGTGATGITFSADGQWLAAGYQVDNSARLWDISILDSESEPKILYGHESRVTSVAFSPDGRWLATGSMDNTARLWPVSSPYADPLSLPGHEDGIYDLAFSRDGQWLATASQDGTARLWPMADPITSSTILTGHEGSIRLATFSNDGRWLAAASTADTSVRLWQTAAPSAPATELSGHTASINALAFSPGCERPSETAEERYGCWLATASGDTSAPQPDNTVRLWSVSDPTAASIILHKHEKPIKALAFSPEGKWLAMASEDSTAWVWDIANLKAEPLVLRRGDSSRGGGVAFSPDGRWLATIGEGIFLWSMDSPSAEPSHVLLRYEMIEDLAFSPDGQWLVIATDLSSGYKILLWNMSDLTATPMSLRGHRSSISGLAFSPEGRWLASGSLDSTVRLWDLLDLAAPPIVLNDLGREVWDVAFSPDGTRLAAGGNDRSVRLWLLPAHKLVELACRTAERNLNQDEWEQYFFGETYRKVCPDLPPDQKAIAHMLAEVVRLARSGNIESAEVQLQLVKTLQPTAVEAEMQARRYAAQQVVDEGVTFALISRFAPEWMPGAFDRFEEAQTIDPGFEPPWDFLCHTGSHTVQVAEEVLDACERAVFLAPEDGAIRGKRGLARALTGNIEGAIADFEFAVQWAEETGYRAEFIESRQAWIEALKAGKNPFDAEALERLWNEETSYLEKVLSAYSDYSQTP
jgi:WD40 repeat protein